MTFNRATRAIARLLVSGHFTSFFIVSFRLIRDRARTLRLHTHTHTLSLSLLPHLFCALAFPFGIATRLGSPSPNSPYSMHAYLLTEGLLYGYGSVGKWFPILEPLPIVKA